MKKDFKEQLKNIPKHSWILAGIMVLAIFLRCYNFHSWLEFKGDQARDAGLVYDVVEKNAAWPLLGPAMGGTGVGMTNNIDGFRLGPAYYDLQITAAKIFGDYPDKLAYFDLLFSLLTIPLLYYFLKKYFSQNLALALTGLYSVSYFAVLYGRFAWNPNAIPFFVLLFLLSLLEFISKQTKTGWQWVIILGAAMGIGVQLHAILMILFPLTSLFVFGKTLRSNSGVWKKWTVVFLLVISLNTPQLISEFSSHFANSKIFLSNITGHKDLQANQEQANISTFAKMQNNLDCHVEANFYMLTSLGQDNCSYYFAQLFSGNAPKGLIKDLHDPAFDLFFVLSLFFVPLGIALFVWSFKKQNDEAKKTFLGVIVLYMLLSLLVMFPIIKGKLEFRYFNYAFFLPFIFLGLAVEFLEAKFPRNYQSIATILFIMILLANIATLATKVLQITDNNIINTHLVTLGDMELVIDYLKTHSASTESIEIGGDPQIISFAFGPLKYLAQQQQIELTEYINSNTLQKDKPVYYLSNKAPSDQEYAKINAFYIFKLNN